MTRMHAAVVARLSVLLVLVPLSVVTGSPAHAVVTCGSVGYSYDPSGRLVGVSQADGAAAAYDLDPVGNVTAVRALGTPALTVHSITPVRGPAGTVVTISGGCFAAAAQDNEVRFDGVVAAVTAASLYRLVAVVPPGLPTGDVPIAVTVAGATASSPRQFKVTAGSAAGPAITGVSATVVAPGDTVTISGSGFDPVPVWMTRCRCSRWDRSRCGCSTSRPGSG